jgi:hypothetical protein
MARFRWLTIVMYHCCFNGAGIRSFPSWIGPKPSHSPLTLPRSHEERERGYRAIRHITLNVVAADEFNLR